MAVTRLFHMHAWAPLCMMTYVQNLTAEGSLYIELPNTRSYTKSRLFLSVKSVNMQLDVNFYCTLFS